ncbi:hypothetical protein GCM10010430_21480 [Kitasatospora cystarginea]|uniref:Uncharacterized protein n=1 Tax=Kitasatospora cystarginea TaxID=58350 RepID=A0ABN3DRA3_9ACTN
MSETTRGSSASPSAAEKLLHPVDTVMTTVSHLPGAATVKDAFGSVLDTVGVVSPRSRRIAAYAGAGLLGAAGLVEWPIAAAGAAVVWLTQPRPGGADEGATAGTGARATRTTRRAAAKPSAKAKSSAKRPATTKPRTKKTATTKAKRTTQSGGRRTATAAESASAAGG